MSIRKSLGNLVTAYGGTPTAKSVRGLLGELSEALGGSSDGRTVSELLDNIVVNKDPLFGVKVDVAIDDETDLLGKTVDDLQSGVSVGDDRIFGKLKYINDYTGFSSDLDYQKGHYLAVHVSVPDVEGATIKVKLTKEVTLDSDGLFVGYIKNGQTQTLTVTASKEGYGTAVKVYKLNLQMEKVSEE